MAFGIGSPGMTGAIAGGPQALQLAYLRDPRLALAAQLQQTGADSSPVQSPWQGAARLAQALMGGYQANRVRGEYEKQAEEYANERRDLYAPVMEQGASGPGPRADARMRPATPEELLARAQNLRSPFLQDDVRQIQTMAMQDAQRRADPMFGRVAVRGVGLVDMRGGQPQVVVPERRNEPRFQNVPGVGLVDISGQTPQVAIPTREREEFDFKEINGRLVAINKRNPNQRQDLGAAGNGGFQGTGMDPQAWNILTNPQSDPTSPTYAAAYAHLTQPKFQMVPGPDGNPVMSLVTPTLPPNIRPPVFAQQGQPPAQPQAPQQAPQAPSAMPQPEAAPAPQATPGAPTQPQTVQLPGASVTQIAPARPKDLTETQARANLFGTQMREAEDILATTRVPSAVAIQAWRSLPESAVNMALNENDQKYFNALRLFAAGVLRKETGAAFTPNELLDVQSRYFPMPGDNPSVMAQKARNRQQVQEAIRAELPGGNFRGLLPPNEAGAANNDPLGIRGGR